MASVTLPCSEPGCTAGAAHMVEAGFHPYYWTPRCDPHTPPRSTTRPVEADDTDEVAA